MAHLLQHDHLTLQVHLPEEHYHRSRFDWTGKITQVTYKGLPLLGSELPTGPDDRHGRGLYNEFGFKLPLGYGDLSPGHWYPKIGIGRIKSDTPVYDFLENCPIRPAVFESHGTTKTLSITCTSALSLGYAYVLQKNIELLNDGWDVRYRLHNTGEKTIITNEYTHNFISIHGQPTDASCHLSFPFRLDPDIFDETINPEGLVRIGTQEITFLGQPSVPFFFSYMSGPAPVKAQWTLHYRQLGLGISESGDFLTQNVCLWGSGHVISPELFIDIRLPAGKSMQWTRQYRLFDL